MTIQIISSPIRALGVSINTQPPVPKKGKELTIAPSNFQNWVQSSLYPKESHPALLALGNCVRMISFNEFANGLHHCVSSLPNSINGRCVILISYHKSNQWVAELAAKFEKFTGTYLSLGHDNASEYVDNIKTIKAKELPQNIVLFDDASFSGKQMTGHVTHIVEAMNAKGTTVKGTIYVVIPFITSVASSRLKAIDTGQLNLRILSYQFIKTVKELVTPTQYSKLMTCFTDQLKEKETDTGVAATYFQHKIPNTSSFIFFGIQGLLPKISPPYIGASKGLKLEEKARDHKNKKSPPVKKEEGKNKPSSHQKKNKKFIVS